MSSPPDLLKTFRTVLEKLEGAKIDYMVVGSIASILYGETRMTRDMGLVVELKTNISNNLKSIFSESEFYLPPDEIISNEIASRGQFNLLHVESGLKVDFIVRKASPHSIEEFKRRKKMPFTKDFSAWLASPKDVIIKKLSYYREGGSDKHLTDIRGILLQTEIDQSYLTHWINELQLESYLKKV